MRDSNPSFSLLPFPLAHAKLISPVLWDWASWDGGCIGTGAALGRGLHWDGTAWDGAAWNGAALGWGLHGMGAALGWGLHWDGGCMGWGCVEWGCMLSSVVLRCFTRCSSSLFRSCIAVFFPTLCKEDLSLVITTELMFVWSSWSLKVCFLVDMII
jgi:hypothetical protein